MHKGNVCLVNDSLINYCSGIVYNDRSLGAAYTHLREYIGDDLHEERYCFYDEHLIHGNAVGLPKKYKDGKFTVWGYFCSCECARAYIHAVHIISFGSSNFFFRNGLIIYRKVSSKLSSTHRLICLHCI